MTSGRRATFVDATLYLLILLLIPLPSPFDVVMVEGTVTTIVSPSSSSSRDGRGGGSGSGIAAGRRYRSRPAGFGRAFEYGTRYAADLQYVVDDVQLCGNDYDDDDSNNNNGTRRTIHVVPTADGIPVAILARRGGCTYETKARMASQHTYPRGAVRYLVVYDDAPRNGDDDLVIMMPDGEDEEEEGEGGVTGTTSTTTTSTTTDADGVVGRRGPYDTLGMVFVGHESGIELRMYVDGQAEMTRDDDGGGPRILIDGAYDDDPWSFPPLDGSGAGLAFVLAMFGCACSLSLLLNTRPYANRSGGGGNEMTGHADDLVRSFLLGPRDNDANNNNDGALGGRAGGGRGGGGSSGRRGNGLRLLTMEEVETLPTMEYRGSRSSSPSIDLVGWGTGGDREEVELRDKTNLPHSTGGEDVVGRHDEDCEVNNYDDDDDDDDVGDVATVDRADYDVDEHGHNRHDAPSRSRGPGGGRGLREVDLPPTRDDGEDVDMGGDDNDAARRRFNQRICSICLDEYEPRERIRVLPCQHTFHSDCIFPWLTERSPTCPLCKAMFEAVQCEVDDAGAAAAAAAATTTTTTTTTTGGSAGAAVGDDGAVAATAADGTTPSSSGEATSDPSNGVTTTPPSSNHQRATTGMRGRLLRGWGFFGGGGGDGALTHPLEEPLLAIDDDIGEGIV